MKKSIKIQLSKIEKSTIDPEIVAFAPIECMNCHFDDYIPSQYYLVTPGVETEDDYDELLMLVKEQLGHDKFTSTYCDLGEIICVARCPKCSSEDIFQDF